MYDCFGFSLARSRRARTIDLQCQSISLRRAFLLRSVCLSCMSVSRSRARFRRARTIDLQWQLLSLLRAFLLRSVSVSAPNRRESSRLLANSLAKSIEKHIENRLKIDSRRRPGAPKIISKSLRDPLGRPRGVQERPERVSGASRERPGASPAPSGRARRVAKGDPGRQKGCPGAPGSVPRRPKS